MREIYRRCFASLNHDKGSHYIVLIDGWFDIDIWADSDSEAISEFINYCRKETK